MRHRATGRLVIGLCGLLMLSACEDGDMPGFLQSSPDGETTATARSTRTVERDVEAPEVFQVTDRGLWDGRPSLGGVWVAHPEAKEPERVIIRNTENENFVVGVLYRPERSQPGPQLQVSSDAAEALGMLAGKPAELNVTALRREEVSADDPAEAEAETDAQAAAAAPEVAEETLDPIAAAGAAIDEAEAAAPARPARTTQAATPRPAASSLEKPYIQIGIFSVQGNANNTSESLRRAGMVPTIKPGKMNGKDFWRVIVGPAPTSAERAQLLKKIKELGFTDAYYVTH
jgi:cell division septation protein DedD